ncbi:roadblock/LC7 domain-containing protein [Actinomadura xylanilytica]|uniref:roadblock/LC7 domain-containing protein n=1 Tax=Actinomadura xylanilytica TaxID=887459 RepID=UPI00255B0EEA|nr:roadblock/LC7 domain-containing protein [Actinomadura xylanilytica]MDL4774193.1 roadblock/LC7 domain-containing protein [Actinomadura xylanilytica]
MTTHWVLEPLEKVAGITHAVLSSTDGLISAWTNSLERDEAERLAAACTSMLSIARSVAGEHGAGGKAVHQVNSVFEGGVLLVRGVAEGTCLTVLAAADSNLAVVGQEMQAMVASLSPGKLATPERATAAGTRFSSGAEPRSGGRG